MSNAKRKPTLHVVMGHEDLRRLHEIAARTRIAATSLGRSAIAQWLDKPELHPDQPINGTTADYLRQTPAAVEFLDACQVCQLTEEDFRVLTGQIYRERPSVEAAARALAQDEEHRAALAAADRALEASS